MVINHPGHYMKITEMQLPQSLFTEVTGPDGTQTRLIVPDKLVAWAEQGRGDAIARLCDTVYADRLASIDAWESDRIRQLEDELRDAGSDEVMRTRRYEHVKHYHTTREDVVREAEMKRAGIREHMAGHRAALEKLVQDAREVVLAHQMHYENDDILAYILLTVTVFIAVYSLFS